MNYLSSKKLLLIMVGFLSVVLLSVQDVYSQNRGTITGTVLDGLSNTTLPGASIVIAGTQIGTASDTDGRFVLNDVPAGRVSLSITYLGYLEELTTVELAGGETEVITVMLIPDLRTMDEVVVVGYGTQRKSDITGSVASVSPEDLESRPRVSVEQMLQGAAAGLSITVNSSSAEESGNTMLIRGQNSISASNDPLIIVDGIPFSRNLSEINPRDIQSVEVLKDASSTAIYGSRGANGVLLITTKRGKKGDLQVNYDTWYSFDQVIRIPDLMDGETFYNAKIERGETTTAVEDEGFESGRSIDWVELATRNSSKTNHNLSFSGGNDNTTYYLSASYIGANGIAIGDRFDRYTFRLNLDKELFPWVTFTTNTQYGYYDRSGNEANFGHAFQMNPLGVPFNEDGSYTLRTWEDGVYADNPMLTTLNIDSDITRNFNTNNSITLDFPFVEGLSFNLNTGYEFRNRLQQTYEGRNTIRGVRANGQSETQNQYAEDWIIENILTYKREFDKHTIFLTGLYSAQSDWSESHNIDAEGFPNDFMYYYQNNNASLVEPSDSYSRGTRLSQMIRANYSFDNRYLFTFTTRRDGYSAFGDETKFGIFPSVALGWNVANEQFMSNVERVEALKLRVSYGVNGNEAISPYSTLPTLSDYNFVDADDQTLFGYYPNRLGDPSLGWETTTSFNTGLDFGLFNNRLTGSLDAYWSNTTDLLLRKSISNVNGTSSILQNIGETANNGIEFQMSSVNVHTSSFKWSTGFNIAHYNTEIVNVGLTDDDGNNIDDLSSKWFLGQPINVNYHYVFDGIYQEDTEGTPQGDVEAGTVRYLDVNGDGVIDPDDRQVIGRRIPDYTIGLTNTLNYKNWTLSFFIHAVMGITKENELLSTADGDYRQNRYNSEFWTPENRSNVYPRNDSGSEVNPLSMPFYRSADFVRLRDIYLGYSVPDQLLNRIRVKNLEVYMNVKNLVTITDWVGLDPEFDNQTAVPQTASYLFGVNIGL
jgi:TonB-linked SusC/RagA family outer membrane protein